MDLDLNKKRDSRLCQVGMDGFVGTSNPQVAGSIPAGGANSSAIRAIVCIEIVEMRHKMWLCSTQALQLQGGI